MAPRLPLDPKGDCTNDAQEWIAGIHPRDPQSVLRLSCAATNGWLDLSFVAVGGRELGVEITTIAVVSTMTESSPFLMAIAAE